MAPTTATRESGDLSTAPRPSLAVATSDAVTHRRITAALAEGGCLATADSAVVDPALEGVQVLVLAVDLSHTDAAAVVRAACEGSPGSSVVVVSPPGRDWEVRRALRAGAHGIVFDGGPLELSLPAAVRAAAAGLVAVPRALRHQVVKPVFSAREREIIGLVAEGATNREIADRLYLAESTVKSHLSTAFTKLGVRSRAEAAALVLDPDERPIDVFAHPPTGDDMALGANGSRGGSI
jgi:DNA-binding NarL/FixJ family response regulator